MKNELSTLASAVEPPGEAGRSKLLGEKGALWRHEQPASIEKLALISQGGKGQGVLVSLLGIGRGITPPSFLICIG
jgi:hypothetical protein